MKEAKWKDDVTVKSVSSHVGKCASLLLPKSKDEWGPIMTINFMLLRSPLLVSGDPDTIIMSHKPNLCSLNFNNYLIHALEEFSASLTLLEILWNFSHYNDHAHITLKQNPHFYLDIPSDESTYMPLFWHHPVNSPSVGLGHNSTVYVLFDGMSHLFLDIGLNLRIFCNVWSLNSVLIFRGLQLHFFHFASYSDIHSDHFGVLEGEQLVWGSSI